jgi:hypothetical protein
VPCQLKSGWNHVTLQVQRQADNSLLYQSITSNGTLHTLNKQYPPGTAPANWYGLAANYQVDSNSQGSPNVSYVDNFTVTYW